MSMYIPALGRFERINKRKAQTIAAVFLVLLIFILLFPLLSFPDPPPGQEGITVNLGIPDVGQGNENAPAANAQPVEEETEEQEEPTPPEPEEEVEELKPEPKPEPKKEVTAPKKEVVKTEDPEAVALRKKKERAAKERAEAERKKKAEDARKKAEAEEKRKAAAEAERKRKAAEAKRKADADALKDLIGGGLQGGGSGKGNTGKPGNEGRADGDPSGLGSIGGGSGTVQGFGDRGFNKPGGLNNPTNKSGTVVIDVCVDKNGNVISTKSTQKGSTTNDSQLVSIAKSHAKKYRFEKSSRDKQCGSIVYNFKFN